MAHQLAAAAFGQSSERFRASVPATIFPDELSNVLIVKLRERDIGHTSDWRATTILHHRKPKKVVVRKQFSVDWFPKGPRLTAKR